MLLFFVVFVFFFFYFSLGFGLAKGVVGGRPGLESTSSTTM